MKINKRRLWGDFVLTLVLHGISGVACGVFCGVVVTFVVCAPGYLYGLYISSEWLIAVALEHLGAVGVWFLLWAVAGCVWGMLTIPEENRPWHVLRRLREREQREAEAQAEAQRVRDTLRR